MKASQKLVDLGGRNLKALKLYWKRQKLSFCDLLLLFYYIFAQQTKASEKVKGKSQKCQSIFAPKNTKTKNLKQFKKSKAIRSRYIFLKLALSHSCLKAVDFSFPILKTLARSTLLDLCVHVRILHIFMKWIRIECSHLLFLMP